MNKSSKITLLWFRRDLRLYDNPALNWVCENSEQVIPVYIQSEEEEQPWSAGAASKWYLHHSLQALELQLQQYDLELNYYCGNAYKVIKDLIAETGADSLVFNKLYDPHLYERDKQLYLNLHKDMAINVFDAGLFLKPGSILNNQEKPYRVFTPFYRKARMLLESHDQAIYPQQLNKDKLAALYSLNPRSGKALSSLNLLGELNWYQKFEQYWQPGELSASSSLEKYIHETLFNYEQARDIPSMDGTSRISVALHFGELTAKQLLANLRPFLEGLGQAKDVAATELFLKQILWREFAHHILWHFPHTSTEPMNPRYKESFWTTNKKHLLAWQRGETGEPIVDAGMKQLWETGWMHNRVRMIVSSYLTKNLGIHWMEGAKWFWDTLLDADLANNSMGWQWVAGCGVDAAPYYRIFNPQTQAKRFDAEEKYIDMWLPEKETSEYPQAIVDLKESREQALERYKAMIPG